MIYIGLSENQKHREIQSYVKANGIKKVFVLSPQKRFMTLPELDIPIRQIEYKETIMYRTFYPLLEEIDKTCLIVFNEFMRTSKRTDLVYNCCAKYTNQTPHRMVFEYLPLIASADDIMVLLDFDLSQRYKGQGIKDIDLSEQAIQMTRREYSLNGIEIEVPPEATSEYAREAQRQFDNIKKGDPDNIPRRLEKWCNKYRKPYIIQHPEIQFLVGAGSGCKMSNVTSRKNATAGDYVLVDLPFNRLEWSDMLFTTGMQNITYLKTPFKVDEAYEAMFDEWRKELEKLYAQTSVYAGDG